LTAKIENSGYEEAVAISFPLQTAVAAFHAILGMGKPGTGSPEEKVLVWGAGGAVGSYAVQYAKSVGHTVIVTASPRDFERQISIGASEVLDYKDPEVLAKLKTLGPFKYAISASGDETSQRAIASLLSESSEGGKFASVLGGDYEFPPNVERIYMAFSMVAQGEEYKDFAEWYYAGYLPEILSDGSVKPAAFVKRGGGLAGLQEASKDVFEGKVRGKLVVNPQEG